MLRSFLLLALPVALLAARPQGRPAAAPASTGPITLASLDLAPLWRLDANNAPATVHNGFIGSNYQRLEMVITSMTRDAQNPGRYLVRGQDRRYQRVRRFSGSFTFEGLEAGEAQVRKGRPLPPPYTATGRFALREADGGKLAGTLAVDFARYPDGRLALYTQTSNDATRGGGFLLRGTWTAGSITRRVLLKNGTAVTHQVMSGFDVGDRSPMVNPKYARVGWDDYWRNEEWWDEGPVAQR